MTTWSASGVAKYAKQAGWEGDALAEAVAVALAASNGQDHYRYNPGALDSTERRGLFALLSDDHPLGSAVDLFNPQQSALAAYTRWKAEGRHWRWHLAWVSGAALGQIDFVRAALANGDRQSVGVAPGAFADHLQSVIHYTRSIREAADRMGGSHG